MRLAALDDTPVIKFIGYYNGDEKVILNLIYRICMPNKYHELEIYLRKQNRCVYEYYYDGGDYLSYHREYFDIETVYNSGEELNEYHFTIRCGNLSPTYIINPYMVTCEFETDYVDNISMKYRRKYDKDTQVCKLFNRIIEKLK
jgi:hypothetical protein